MPTDDSKPQSMNQQVAARLREAADLLALQGANPFRVSAYRRAADTVASLDRDVRAMVEREGAERLQSLPGIGRGIAAAIIEIVATGRWSQLERLRGELDPERLFQSVPGIGPVLAERLHEQLHIDTLEALETAAHDGRLERVSGIGPRRAAVLRAVLETMLGRVRSRARHPARAPSAAVLLGVDREYREKAAEGSLPTIAPRRFNPESKAWLPILHTDRDGWHFTALYSNTARAHDLGRTRDWVVLYFYDDSHEEGQHTVVTETRGALKGKRVVRGLEGPCRAYYAASESERTDDVTDVTTGDA